MKNSLLLKVGFVLPLIFFIDYILMVLVGCATCLFGFGNDFYCGPYCLTGKIILGLSGIFFLFLIFPDIKELLNKAKNGEAPKK
jgi:hypothetical protein